MSCNEPVRNGCEVIYEIFYLLNCGFEIKTDFFRLLYAIAEIAFITAMIIANT